MKKLALIFAGMLACLLIADAQSYVRAGLDSIGSPALDLRH